MCKEITEYHDVCPCYRGGPYDEVHLPVENCPFIGEPEDGLWEEEEICREGKIEKRYFTAEDPVRRVETKRRIKNERPRVERTRPFKNTHINDEGDTFLCLILR